LIWDEAVTNWEPGLISLQWLLEALKILRDNTNIVGMDIVGDYSPVRTSSRLREFLVNWDHPEQLAETMDESKISEINDGTNMKILNLFLR
jgi:hypothetical protein